MSGRLYALLPTYIRAADDAVDGHPLRALLALVEEQADILHADIAQLYENWFIETCADWAVPYIGELVGYRPPVAADFAGAIPRGEVADIIRTRRRKGTLGVLESVTRDLTGWPAVAIEFERAIAAAFSPLARRSARERTLDVRDSRTLSGLRDARSTVARGVAARGAYTIGSLGLVVSRLQAYRVSRSDAACVVTVGDHAYTFDALGFDVPLVSASQALPAALSAHDLLREYGETKSVALWTRPSGDRTRLEAVAAERIVPADLRHWRFRPKLDQVAVDVERGRISFAPGRGPDAVVVRYHYAAAAAIGAGEYARDLAPVAQRFPVVHGGREEHRHVRAAIARWKAAAVPRAAITFGDSHVYDETDLRIELAADAMLELRADDGTRPIVRIEDRGAGHLDALHVRGGARSTLVLDGLTIARRNIEIHGDIAHVVIRRCTLVPGQCALVVHSPTVRLTIEHSIVSDIMTVEDETRGEPNVIAISDSIVGGHTRADAIGSPAAPSAFVDLSVARSTLFGRVRVHGVDRIENAIFTQPLAVRRREAGCVRFSFIAPQSLTPPAFACVSEPAPMFMSRQFATPNYARLAASCPAAIAAGAEVRGEMGAFNLTDNGRKARALQARIAEFVPPDARVWISYLGDA